jgi:hypothetical protein
MYTARCFVARGECRMSGYVDRREIHNYRCRSWSLYQAQGKKEYAPPPIVQFNRSRTEILEQYATPEDMIYKEKVKHLQLLHKHVFDNVNSTVLLLPYSPGVNFINHNNEKANVFLDWSESSWSDKEILEEEASGAIGRKRRGHLMVCCSP